MSKISAGTSAATGFVVTADITGTLEFQSDSVTKVTMETDGTLRTPAIKGITGALNLLNASGSGIGVQTDGRVDLPFSKSDIRWAGAMTTSGVVRRTITTGSIADNVATKVFTVATTNETGSTDGGSYVCLIDAVVTHPGLATSTATAAKRWSGSFTRSMIDTGATGVNTAIENVFSGASAATSAATRDIATITVTATENTEYATEVNFQIDLTGSSIATARVVAEVTVIYSGFTTPPFIS